MRIRSYMTLALTGAAGAALAVSVMTRDAHSSGHERVVPNTLTFDMIDAPVGHSIAPVPVVPPVSTHGSTIASWGDGVVALDGDSGELVRLDAGGTVVARLDIGPAASQFAVDRTRDRIYVVDRTGDRICVINAARNKPRQLESVTTFATAAEPFGVALTPDGETLLVTTIADRQLTAFATDDGSERWSIDVGPEPRGVAVSHDGSRALVTYLSTGAVARVQLGDEPRLAFTPIPAGGGSQTAFGGAFYGGFGGLDGLDLADDLAKVDTPSLIGLAHSAPYYHDGSAPTLEALLFENGSIHGMGNTSQLSGDQVADRASYLRTL